MRYITKDGDRWDLIAYRLYGDPYVYDALLLYNPHTDMAVALICLPWRCYLGNIFFIFKLWHC